MAVAVVIASIVLVSGGIATALVLTGNAPATLAGAPVAIPAALGPRRAEFEPFDDLKFGAPPGEVAKAKAALEGKLSACMDSHVERELTFEGTILVAADGRITKATELEICKETQPSFYLCTDRARIANPKRGFPVAPEAAFVCIERTLVSSRLPRVTPEQGETLAKQRFYLLVH
jgi:hypothetical protein